MELRTKEAAYDFAAIRNHLTTCVEILEEAKEEIGLFYGMPPPEIVKHRDLFERIWGWDRFFPVYNLRYLEEYYRRNAKESLAQPQPMVSLVSLGYLGREKVGSSTPSDATSGQQHADSADVDDNLVTILVHLCCQKEKELMSEWKEQGLNDATPEIKLSTTIQKQVINLVLPKKKRIIPPVILDCINCIMKEAELSLVSMRKGIRKKGSLTDDSDENLSHHIRHVVFCLIKKYWHANPSSASVATCAVLLGTTKEAEQMCEKRRQDSLLFGEHTLTTSIRSLALDMLSHDMDAYVLKTATTEGFCYWDYVDPDAIDMPACWCESAEVHVDGSDELRKEKHSTKNKLEEDMIIYDITRGSHALSREMHSTKNKEEDDSL